MHLGLFGTFADRHRRRRRPRGRAADALGWPARRPALGRPARRHRRARWSPTPEVDAMLARLGPDPLRPRRRRRPRRAPRIARSRMPIGALLMDQAVLAGVGNVYRAEILFRHRHRPVPARAASVDAGACWTRMWADLVDADAGRRADRPDRHHRPRATATAGAARPGARTPTTSTAGPGCPAGSAAPRSQTAELAGRNLFWCPSARRPGRVGSGRPDRLPRDGRPLAGVRSGTSPGVPARGAAPGTGRRGRPACAPRRTRRCLAT